LTTILEDELARLRLSLPQADQEKLETYVRELERWNKTVNLTALKGNELVRRLIAEPVWIGLELQMSGNLVDVGSGNGCPGVPLCITRQLKRVDLIEARVRRAAFLRHIASKLSPNEIVVHRVRLEEMRDPLEGVDWITLQAVDPAPKLIQKLQVLCASTTRVVWITSSEKPMMRSASRISVPGSNTVAQVSQLDQF
jgi:16S rRNA (guanine(527)-N(7))-methyltransferase RsmG